MKSAKGFGKNYFSLTAICALNSQIKIAKEIQKTDIYASHFEFSDEEEEELLEEILENSLLLSTPSHCNCHYKRKYYQSIKTYNTFFNSLKTFYSNSSPPLQIFYLI